MHLLGPSLALASSLPCRDGPPQAILGGLHFEPKSEAACSFDRCVTDCSVEGDACR